MSNYRVGLWLSSRKWQVPPLPGCVSSRLLLGTTGNPCHVRTSGSSSCSSTDSRKPDERVSFPLYFPFLYPSEAYQEESCPQYTVIFQKDLCELSRQNLVLAFDLPLINDPEDVFAANFLSTVALGPSLLGRFCFSVFIIYLRKQELY